MTTQTVHQTTPTRFIRTTHENGRWRHFPPEARHFWRLHGGLILSLLRPETALTFAELLQACRDYASEHLADGCPEQNGGYVAWVLVHLIRFGMVTAVPPRPTLLHELDWQAIWPLER